MGMAIQGNVMILTNSVKLWTRAAVLSTLTLGVAIASDDNCEPFRQRAPQRPAMRASRPIRDSRLQPVGFDGDEVPPEPLGSVNPDSKVPPPADDLGTDEKKEEAKEEEKKEEEAEEEATPLSLSDLFKDGKTNAFTDAGFKLGGSAAQSFTFNFDSPNDKFNGPVTWTDRSNEYQFNQGQIYLERATSTDECKDWDLGGRGEIIAGTNARFNTAAGLEDQINRQQSFYGISIPQLYLELAYKNFKVKAGHFYSPVGYFTVDTSLNFFNTLPYTYQYGEPFTHTGVLGTFTVDDHLSIGGGVIRGWDAFDRSNLNTTPNAGAIGTTTYTFDDKSSVAYVGVWSNELAQGGAPDPYSSRYLQTFVYTKPFNDCLSYVFQSDFGNQVNAIAGTGHAARWYGINQYLFYKTHEKLTWGANFEWFRDEEGFRVGGFLPSGGADQRFRGLSTDRSGYQGNFYQVTVGPKWNPTPNMIVRPNLRYDWFQGDALNAGGLRPYDDGKKNDQLIFGTDVVFTF